MGLLNNKMYQLNKSNSNIILLILFISITVIASCSEDKIVEPEPVTENPLSIRPLFFIS